MNLGVTEVEIRHFHLCCGLGGGARGFNRGRAQVGSLRARFRCIGGVDVDPDAIADFGKLAGVRGTVLDLFDREQYREFHGTKPPVDWREATPEDIRRAAGNERPHIVFGSCPCKGFSGLLPEEKSRSRKYQALNRLALRAVWLTLEAWADDPPELILFENVPRITTRGRWLLDQIGELLRVYGYSVAETTHDCGELGGLAQSRKRFLLAARHATKVPPFLYEPPTRPLKPVGEVIGKLPLPGDPVAGPMHAIPNLQWRTWVRLAFVEAGSDWRSVNRLCVVDGVLADYRIVPELRNGMLGVTEWSAPAGTVTGWSLPNNGAFAVATPRFAGNDYHTYGVRQWEQASETVTGKAAPGSGAFSIADPGVGDHDYHANIYRVVAWDHHARTVTGASHSAGGAATVADPRIPDGPRGPHFNNVYRVVPWDAASPTISSGNAPSAGGLAVSDPRVHLTRTPADHYVTAGHYGVVPWTGTCGAIAAAACHDNGRWSIADPRIDALPGATTKLVAVIRALDGTWHRPFTTLELAALQSLVDPDELIDFHGKSDSAKRERIGNAVPPYAAQAIADTMGETLLLAMSGERFTLSSLPIWVRPVAVALSVDSGPSLPIAG